MRSSDLAISIRGLGKAYTIAHNAARHVTLAEAALHRLRHPLARPQRETFWALDDVSFDVNKGDVVGVIGRNGAGKSTLLKVLSRITEPTRGTVDLFGRVGSLLEVGTGFHPELTGRENIYLNGNILGMRRREIDRQFDAIVDFAGVERFLDTPVKRYSSGMYVRLAFAVAAHLESEILIVDEVLAVGDAEFQRRCLGKMKDVAGSGRTVLFVSHNMQAVSLLCNTAIYLQGGRVIHQGEVADAIEHYMRSFAVGGPGVADARAARRRRQGSGEYRYTAALPAKDVFDPDEEKRITFRIERQGETDIGQMYLSAHIVDEMGAIVTQCDSRLVGCWVEDAPAIEGEFAFTTPWLKPGQYHVDLYICAAGIVDYQERACSIQVVPLLPYPHTVPPDGFGKGVVLGEFAWRCGARADVTDAAMAARA